MLYLQNVICTKKVLLEDVFLLISEEYDGTEGYRLFIIEEGLGE